MPEFTATDIYFYSQTQHRCEFNSGVRLSQNSPNRQSTTFFTKESFCDLKFFFRFLIGIGLKLLIILHFDFLREPHSAVPLYADECGSLGFVAFSTVSGVSKNTFSTRSALHLCYRVKRFGKKFLALFRFKVLTFAVQGDIFSIVKRCIL